MPVQKTKAIVLGYYPLGEVDRIVVFYTRDFGNIRAVAKGVRRVKSRLCGRLEILTYGELIFFERTDKDLHIVNSFDVIDPFQVLRDDLLKMAYGYYIVELIQQVESPGSPNTYIFDLLLGTLSMMKTVDEPEVLVKTFEIRFLANAGLSPRLDSCVICSAGIGNANVFVEFDIAKGGVICNKCSSSAMAQTSKLSISLGTLELMKKMQQTPLELIPRLKMLEITRRELRRLLKSFISHHLDSKQFRSLEFLASMESDQ